MTPKRTAAADMHVNKWCGGHQKGVPTCANETGARGDSNEPSNGAGAETDGTPLFLDAPILQPSPPLLIKHRRTENKKPDAPKTSRSIHQHWQPNW